MEQCRIQKGGGGGGAILFFFRIIQHKAQIARGSIIINNPRAPRALKGVLHTIFIS